MRSHNVPSSNIKEKITLNYPKFAAMEFFSQVLKNEFETVVVNKPSVFEPLKVYCFLRVCLPMFLQIHNQLKTGKDQELTQSNPTS